MPDFSGPTEMNVKEQSSIGPVNESIIPRSLESVQEEVSSRISTMEEEAVNWSHRVAAVETLTRDFITSAPDGVSIGSGTQCSGVGVSAAGGNTVYTQQTLGGAISPEQHKERFGQYPSVLKHEDGGATTVGTVQTIGRMNGAFGYSQDGNLMVGSLASFSHNWVSKLIGFFERASLPFDGKWQLPNLVLAETDQPAQFHPDASFKFNTRQSAYTSFSVVIQSPEKAEVGFDVRDAKFDSVARVNGTTIPKGESRTVVRAGPFPPSNGVFNIVPRDAPQGLTVKKVTTSPVSF